MNDDESNRDVSSQSNGVSPQTNSVSPQTNSVSPQSQSITQQESDTSLKPTQKRGILVGLASYVFWGFMLLFWKLLGHVDSLEVLAHRMLWSAVFLLPICLITCRFAFFGLFKQRRARLILLGAGLLCAFNWGTFIFAINSGHILQTSMGYYINPLMSIAIGLLFFRERLSLIQKIALILAAIGVLYFTIDYGSFPWMSFALATSFALYGALKKACGYPALPALAVESTMVAPLALAYVAVAFFLPGHAFLALDASGALSSSSLITTLLLVGGGILTFIPLLLFSEAVNTVPLSWMGFMQYITPTITLILGVFAFQEAFTHAHAICFALIWSGLLLIVVESFVKQRRTRQ